MIRGYGSKNTTKFFDILKADLGNCKCYLMISSEMHYTSWSYFLTKGIASDNPERGKSLLLLKGADVIYCCPLCLLPISHSNVDCSCPIRMCLWQCSRLLNNTGQFGNIRLGRV